MDRSTTPEHGVDGQLRAQIETALQEMSALQDQLVAESLAAVENPLVDEDLIQQRRAELFEERLARFQHLGRLIWAWRLRGGALDLRPADRSQKMLTEAAPKPETPNVQELTLEVQVKEAPPTSPLPVVTVDPAMLQKQMGPRWMGARQSTPRPPRAVDSGGLRALLDAVKMPNPSEAGTAFIRREIDVLSAATRSEALGAWLAFPQNVQQALVGLIACRARHLQDERLPGEVSALEMATLDSIFQTLSGFSKREQPGFVHGLARSHEPRKGSWRDDAQDWWQKLQGMLPDDPNLNPERALNYLAALLDDGLDDDAVEGALVMTLEAGVSVSDPRLLVLAERRPGILQRRGRFKALRRAIRDRQQQLADEADEEDDSPLPDGWPYLDRVKNQRAVIVGGDLREEARKRLENAFQFASLEWVTADHARNYQRLATSIENGGVDLVIILRRFIGHDVDRIIIPACQTAGVSWISVDRGYGVRQLCLAIERFLDPD